MKTYSIDKIVTTVAAGAFLAASTGCTQPSARAPVQVPVQESYFVKVQRAQINDNQYSALSNECKRYLDEKGHVYVTKNYAKELGINGDSAPKADAKTTAKADAKDQKGWYDRNKGWFIPTVGLVAVGAAVVGVGEHNDWFQKKDEKKGPVKGGVNPNVGPDNGDGTDKDKGNW